MDEKEIDKKLKEIRKILDDPFHVSPQKDKYLSTLQKRLMKSPPTDSPHVIIFSKDKNERSLLPRALAAASRISSVISVVS